MKVRVHVHELSCLEEIRGSLACKVTGEGAPEHLARVKREPTLPYMAIGRETAAFVLARRKPFSTLDIVFQPETLQLFPPHQRVVPRRYAEQFLHAFRDPDSDANTPGMRQVAKSNPRLADKTKKLWKGY